MCFRAAGKPPGFWPGSQNGKWKRSSLHFLSSEKS